MRYYERKLNNLERGIFTMKLNYNVTEKNLKNKFYKATKLLKVLEEFVNSGKTIAIVELDDGEYKSANSACASLNKACARFGKGVKCSVREGVVYLYYEES